MIWVVATLVVLAAAASLWGSYDTRRDIRTGRPQYESLADFTGVWDRDELARLCGPPDSEDRYHVDAGTVQRLPQKWWVRCFDSIIMDCMSVAAAFAAMWLHFIEHPVSRWLVAIAAAYQAVSWLMAVVAVARHVKFNVRQP